MTRSDASPVTQTTTRRVTTALFMLALLLFAAAGGAQIADEPSGAEPLIDRYLAALTTFDIEAMSALWTEDVVYADPTAGSRLEGKDAVVAALGQGMAGVEDLRFDVRSRFVSNGYAVLIYEGSATMLDTEAGGVPVRAEGVIVLRIEGDLVAEHNDYVDYGAVRRQVEAARALAKGGE